MWRPWISRTSSATGWGSTNSVSLILWKLPTAGNGTPGLGWPAERRVPPSSVLKSHLNCFGRCEFYEVRFTVWCRKRFRSSTSDSSDRDVLSCLVDSNKNFGSQLLQNCRGFVLFCFFSWGWARSLNCLVFLYLDWFLWYHKILQYSSLAL